MLLVDRLQNSMIAGDSSMQNPPLLTPVIEMLIYKPSSACTHVPVGQPVLGICAAREQYSKCARVCLQTTCPTMAT
jgi:hypothetical protein